MKIKFTLAASAVLISFGATSISAESFGGLSSGKELLPPNAKPGECYARVFVPPQYESVEKKVLKSDASQSLSIQPPKFQKATNEIVVEEASFKLEVVPATFETVEKQVEIKPSHTVLKEVPAVYDTVTEKIIDKPAHTVWKEGRGPVEKVDHGTGEILCLVDVPASYKTITKRVLKTPARVETVTIPAEFRTIKTRVMKTPPSTKKVEIPAKTKTVTSTILAEAAKELREETPAQYQTVSQTQLVKEGFMDWKAVLCETNTTKSKVKAIQQALASAGYSVGKADGSFGRQTSEAIKAFQADKGIAQGGVTIETLAKLGVN